MVRIYDQAGNVIETHEQMTECVSAFVVVREALSDAGERFYSTLGFAANMLAGAAYLIWMSFALVIGIRLVFFQNTITVQLNMSEGENGQVPLPRRRVRSRISADIWEQTKTAYASGIGLREIARNMDIPEGTVLARA